MKLILPSLSILTGFLNNLKVSLVMLTNIVMYSLFLSYSSFISRLNASFKILTLCEVNLTVKQASTLFQSIDINCIEKLEKITITTDIDEDAAIALGNMLLRCDNMELCHLPGCELTGTNSEIILKSIQNRKN